ncbi:MAG: GNAT family N-acetyltransferase [Muribaculaceae bacterium]|nr:GNAT family N-acetyltransferase [Muribaculaceae bacterium]
MDLLIQVNNVHAEGRPDIFIKDSTKYTESELTGILEDPGSPVFVSEDEDGRVVAYCFCKVQDYAGHTNLRPIRTLYIDDLCVDAACRGQHIGSALYGEVREWAKANGFHNLTLNVWACNPNAEAFYRALGLTPQRTTLEQLL